MDVPEAAGARGLGGCPGGAHEGAQLWAPGGRGDPGRGLIQLDKKCCRKRHPTEKTGCSENFVRGRRIYCRRRRVWGVQWPRSTVSLRLDFSRLAHPRGVRARGAPSEVSRVSRDPGWEGELQVGGCKGEGVSRPLVLSSYRSFCLVEPETLASSTLLSGSRRDRTPGSKQKVALIDAGTDSAGPHAKGCTAEP